MRFLPVLAMCLIGCNREANIIEYCNNKSRNEAEYAKCMCSKLTRSITWTEEMDECTLDRERSLNGWEGE